MSVDVHHVWWIQPVWGHVTSAHALISKCLQLNGRLRITILYHVFMKDRILNDIKHYPDTLESSSRVDIVFLGDATIPPSDPSFFKSVADAMRNGLLDYVASSKSPISKIMLDPWGGLDVMKTLREKGTDETEFWLQWSAGTTWLYTVLAPAPNGMGDWKRVLEHFSTPGLPEEQRESLQGRILAARNGGLETNGTVVHLPGLPDVFDYEREQENIPPPPSFWNMMKDIQELVATVDGNLAFTSTLLEGDAVSECSKYNKTIAMGVQVNPRAWTGSTLQEGELSRFLNRQQDKEVLFVSFGSMFWPTQHLDALIETLLESQRPFLIASGGPLDNKLEAHLISLIESSPNAHFHQGWFDQISILQHPSIGWFLTHAGWNSIQEGIVCGVPMIAWPLMHSDQVVNAMVVAERPRPIGYQLVQIRQGRSMKVTKSGTAISGEKDSVKQEIEGVLDDAFRGKGGEERRRNVLDLRDRLRNEEEHPSAELQSFASN